MEPTVVVVVVVVRITISPKVKAVMAKVVDTDLEVAPATTVAIVTEAVDTDLEEVVAVVEVAEDSTEEDLEDSVVVVREEEAVEATDSVVAIEEASAIDQAAVTTVAVAVVVITKEDSVTEEAVVMEWLFRKIPSSFLEWIQQSLRTKSASISEPLVSSRTTRGLTSRKFGCTKTKTLASQREKPQSLTMIRMRLDQP